MIPQTSSRHLTYGAHEDRQSRRGVFRGRQLPRHALILAPAVLLLWLTLAAVPALASPGPPELGTQFQVEGGTQYECSLEEGLLDNDEDLSFTTGGPFRVCANAHGLTTEWHFEYAESESGPWVEVPDGSGSLPAEENHLSPNVISSGELVGLTPETVYYVRVVAKNSAGERSEIVHFETLPLRPRGSCCKIEKVTDSSAQVEVSIRPDGFEGSWRLEYAESKSGPWTPAPGASGPITQAQAEKEYYKSEGRTDGSESVHDVLRAAHRGKRARRGNRRTAQ